VGFNPKEVCARVPPNKKQTVREHLKVLRLREEKPPVKTVPRVDPQEVKK
jgi:hypothetical protein